MNDSKIIMVLDGIDFFKDSQTKKEAITAFWMPKVLPSRVRLILTSNGKNNAMDYFSSMRC